MSVFYNSYHDGALAEFRRMLSESVNAECNCGGRGPNDHPCMACRVWWRFDQRIKDWNNHTGPQPDTGRAAP